MRVGEKLQTSVVCREPWKAGSNNSVTGAAGQQRPASCIATLPWFTDSCIARRVCTQLAAPADSHPRAGRKLGENKLLSTNAKVAGETSVRQLTTDSAGVNKLVSKCKICKQRVNDVHGTYCQKCAFAKGSA